MEEEEVSMGELRIVETGKGTSNVNNGGAGGVQREESI